MSALLEGGPNTLSGAELRWTQRFACQAAAKESLAGSSFLVPEMLVMMQEKSDVAPWDPATVVTILDLHRHGAPTRPRYSSRGHCFT